MKKYDLSPAQQGLLERSFMMITNRDGWAEKFEAINEKIAQTGRYCVCLTPESKEQVLAIEKLREAAYWFEQAIRKNET